MGACISFFHKKEPKKKRKLQIALFGLDNAGKTTTARGLAGEPLQDVAPTIGFCSFNATDHKRQPALLFDLGGGRNIRGIWRQYLAEVHGLIFVVDSSDQARLEEASLELVSLVQHPLVRGKPLLILANKQDLVGSMDRAEMCHVLHLHTLVCASQCPCLLECCSAQICDKGVIDNNITKGFKWLTEVIKVEWGGLDARVRRDVEKKEEEEEEEKKRRKERVLRKRMGDAENEISTIEGEEINNVGDNNDPNNNYILKKFKTNNLDQNNNSRGDNNGKPSGEDDNDEFSNPFKPIQELTSSGKSNKKTNKSNSRNHKSRNIFSRLRSYSQQSDSRRVKENQVSPVPAS